MSCHYAGGAGCSASTLGAAAGVGVEYVIYFSILLRRVRSVIDWTGTGVGKTKSVPTLQFWLIKKSISDGTLATQQ